MVEGVRVRVNAHHVHDLWEAVKVRMVNKASGAGRIAEQIGSAIVSGVYRADQLVPGEIELSRRFQASRPVVREALKLLSAKGLIDSRKRAGTRARSREAWHMLDADVLAWRLKSEKAEPKFVFDLLQARTMIEPAAAAMAALNHTPRTLKLIETAFADMEANVHDRALFAEPDIRFHKAILTATGNDFIAAFGALIETALGAFVRIASRHEGAPGPSVPLHRDIFAAVRRRDAEGARSAMLVLLKRTSRNVELNAGKQGSYRPRRHPR